MSGRHVRRFGSFILAVFGVAQRTTRSAKRTLAGLRTNWGGMEGGQVGFERNAYAAKRDTIRGSPVDRSEPVENEHMLSMEEKTE